MFSTRKRFTSSCLLVMGIGESVISFRMGTIHGQRGADRYYAEHPQYKMSFDGPMILCSDFKTGKDWPAKIGNGSLYCNLKDERK